MSQVFSEGRHVFFFVRTKFKWNSFFVKICCLADVGELGGGFRFRRVGRDKVAGEAALSVSRASLGTENKGCALRQFGGVA